MKEQFPAVFALLGVEEMQLGEEGTFFNKDLLATLNASIEAKNQENADAQALVQSLTQEKENLTQQVADLNSQVETLNAEHAKAIDDLNAAHAAAIEEKDNAITAMQSDMEGKAKEINALKSDIESKQIAIDGAKESLKKAEGIIAERDQQITDLNAQIEELQKEPGEGAQAGSPASNGMGVETTEVAISTQYVMDPSKSYEENMKAKKEWEASRK